MTDYDTWKTTPPVDLVECADCEVLCEEGKHTIEGPGGHRVTVCASCHELYDPRIP